MHWGWKAAAKNRVRITQIKSDTTWKGSTGVNMVAKWLADMQQLWGAKGYELSYWLMLRLQWISEHFWSVPLAAVMCYGIGQLDHHYYLKVLNDWEAGIFSCQSHAVSYLGSLHFILFVSFPLSLSFPLSPLGPILSGSNLSRWASLKWAQPFFG